MSEWVAGAMAPRHARDQRLAMLSELIRDYERAHGVITDDEIAEQQRRRRSLATGRKAGRCAASPIRAERRSVDGAPVAMAAHGDQIITSDPDDSRCPRRRHRPQG